MLTYVSIGSTNKQHTVPKCCRDSLPVVVEGAVSFVVGSRRDQGYHYVVVFSQVVVVCCDDCRGATIGYRFLLLPIISISLMHCTQTKLDILICNTFFFSFQIVYHMKIIVILQYCFITLIYFIRLCLLLLRQFSFLDCKYNFIILFDLEFFEQE